MEGPRVVCMEQSLHQLCRPSVVMKIQWLRVIFAVNVVLFVLGLLRYLSLSSHVTTLTSHDVTKDSSAGMRSLQEDSSSGRACPCTGQQSRIPNIVHYIWYNEQTVPIKFHQMLGVLSAHKVLQPEVIYFHTDREPNGPYWDMVKRIPSVRVLYRKPPVTLFGEPVKKPMYYTSHSNVDRVKILQEYGGIYFDFDVLVLRSFDPLRHYSCVIGLEQETQACGSVIACQKNAFFLTLWLNAYLDDYQVSEWAYNTGKVPWKLWKRYPHLVHAEKRRINHPNFKELDSIWGPSRFDWKRNYAIHTWYRLWKSMSPYYEGIEPSPETIKTMNNTFGEIARTIYYGSPDLFS